MQIMTQDNRRLVNGDFVSSVYIENASDGVKLIAAADTDILLGSYDKMEHAEKALKFIGICLVDEDVQSKITQVPTRADMALKDDLFSEGLNPDGMKKLFERAMSLQGSTRKS